MITTTVGTVIKIANSPRSEGISQYAKIALLIAVAAVPNTLAAVITAEDFQTWNEGRPLGDLSRICCPSLCFPGFSRRSNLADFHKLWTARRARLPARFMPLTTCRIRLTTSNRLRGWL